MSVAMRLRQGFRALTAWSRPVDVAQAAAILTPAELELFSRLRRSEQLHSLNVLHALRDAGHTERDLLVAALLHDVGKTVAPFYFHERVLVVLVRKLIPALYWRWAAGDPQGWTRPFALSARHPVWSAELLRGAGSSPRAVELARRHQDELDHPPHTEFERLLAALQAADDTN